MVATIEATCFPRLAPPAPSLNTPHHAPPGAPQEESSDARGIPLFEVFAVPQREPAAPPDATPALPSTPPAAYTVADLEPLTDAYVASTGADAEIAAHFQKILDGFLLFLEREEAEAHAAATFAAACGTLAQTGDVVVYTTAMLAAQQAGLTPARMKDLLREAMRTSQARLPSTVLHDGTAPGAHEEGVTHVSE